jgi:hypothetical protein
MGENRWNRRSQSKDECKRFITISWRNGNPITRGAAAA